MVLGLYKKVPLVSMEHLFAGLSLLLTLEEQGALMDLIDYVPSCRWRHVHRLVLLGPGRQGCVSERECVMILSELSEDYRHLHCCWVPEDVADTHLSSDGPDVKILVR